LTLGIYLLHPIAIGALNRLSFFHFGIAGQLKFLAAFCLSALAVYFLKLTRFKVIV